MAKNSGYENSNSTPIANYTITDGQLSGIDVRIQNPNFPYGDVNATEVVVDDWLDTNFPEVTQDELTKMGIDVTYTPGDTEYFVYGKEVSEEEFQKKIDAYNVNDSIKTTGNQTHIIPKVTDKEENETITYAEVGYSQQSPGVIKVSLTNLDQLNGINEDGTITESTANNLNQITGADVFNAGTTIYDTIDKLKTEIGLDRVKSLGVIWVCAFEEELTTKAGLVGKLDANDSEMLNTIDNMAKTLSVVGGIAKIMSYIAIFAFGEEYAAAKVLNALADTAPVAKLIDLIIDDRDEEFRIESEGEYLEIYSTQKNGKGESIFGNYQIHMNYDDPDKLYNSIVSYIESSKYQLVNKMVNLKEDIRANIITKVKDDIILLAQTDVTKSNAKALSDIMMIDYLSFHYDYICFVGDMFSQFSPSNEEKKYKYTVRRKVNIGTITYSLHRQKIDRSEYVEEINELNTAYSGSSDLDRTLVYQSVQMPPEVLETINSNFVKSYYKKYADEEEGLEHGNVTTFINEVCDLDYCVQTGEVDLWRSPMLGDTKNDSNRFNINNDSNRFNINNDDYLEEAQRNKTNFMSIHRIELAISMVEEVYNIYLDILLKNIEVADRTKQTEQKIISEWDKALGKKSIK